MNGGVSRVLKAIEQPLKRSIGDGRDGVFGNPAFQNFTPPHIKFYSFRRHKIINSTYIGQMSPCKVESSAFEQALQECQDSMKQRKWDINEVPARIFAYGPIPFEVPLPSAFCGSGWFLKVPAGSILVMISSK